MSLVYYFLGHSVVMKSRTKICKTFTTRNSAVAERPRDALFR